MEEGKWDIDNITEEILIYRIEHKGEQIYMMLWEGEPIFLKEIEVGGEE